MPGLTAQPAPGRSARHLVQLYGEDLTALARAVCPFIIDGLARGEGVLVLASAAHREALAARLDAEAAATVGAVAAGRLVFLDAADTLTRIMADGAPDERRLDEVLGGVLCSLRDRSARSRVRVYGEMVGLLWAAGEPEAAVRLEAIWNAMLGREPMDVFCGYPIDAFAEEADAERLHPILCAHTELVGADGGLDRAIDRAMDELLGADEAGRVRATVAASAPPSWGAMPRAEATMLWLRSNLRERAGEIVERARFYRASSLDAPAR